MKIIIAIIIFSAIILFHELGHFLLAKKNKIVVTEFSLGMGPRLLSTERNGTRYSLKLLPIGGSCAMLGEDTDEEDEPGTFSSAPVGGRIAVVAAGPVFNFIMAFVLSVIIVGMVGYEPSTVLSVKEGSAAEAAGLKEGDVITSYQGYHVDLGKDIYVYSYMNELKEGDTVRLTVKRDGEKKEISYQSDTNVRYLLGCNFKGDDTTAMTVESVMEGMPLDDAGVKEGDVITSINGVKIGNAQDYQDYIKENPLTGDPVEEIKSAKLILKTLGLRKGGIEVVSCPTCGRTKIDLIGLANKVEEMVADIPLDIKVAVMGCVVNGPGEAKEADIGIAGGIGEGLLIKKGEVVKKVKEDELLETLRQELLHWNE